MPGFPLPEARFESATFWSSGADNKLMIHQCGACDLWLHPPKPICRRCRSQDVNPQQVRGTGAVYSYTINRQPWLPGIDVPYIIAVIELDEDPELRLTTRLLEVSEEDVRIGMRVQVHFEQNDDVWVPLFTPEVRTTTLDEVA